MALAFSEGDDVAFRSHWGTVREIREDGPRPSYWVVFDDPAVMSAWFTAESLDARRDT